VRPGRWAGARTTQAIVVVTVVCWLVGLIPGVPLASWLGFAPAVSVSEPWRALTVVLVHDSPSPLHLLFNMVGVLVFGSFLERALGPWRFLVVYALSALGGSAAVLLLASPFDPSWVTLHVGASGALFGLLGVVLTPTRRLDRNLGGALAFLVLNLVFSFVTPGVSWESHLGGLVVGFALGCAALLPRPRRTAAAAAHADAGADGRVRGGAGARAGVASLWFWPASLIVAGTLLLACWPHLRAAAMLG
jgi:membrane associated rhomboid family serine protease